MHYIVGMLYSFCYGSLNGLCVFASQIVNKILITGYFQAAKTALDPSDDPYC